MENPPDCIICLEPPLDKSPLLLFTCGCKVGWFHDSCKNNWLDFQANQGNLNLNCPACRRIIPMKINYSFDWRAGPEQYYLCQTGLLFTGEVVLSISLIMSGITNAYIIPLQSVLIFCLPFIFNSPHTIFFYLNNIRIRSVIICVYILFHLCFLFQSIHKNPLRTFYHLAIPGTLQITLLLLTHLQNNSVYVNPLLPFAISRELILAAKCSALPAERNE